MECVDCNLSPALLEIVEASALLGVHDDETLAEYLHRDDRTIATEWNRILARMDVHWRNQAVHQALIDGSVRLPTLEEFTAAWEALIARSGGRIQFPYNRSVHRVPRDRGFSGGQNPPSGPAKM